YCAVLTGPCANTIDFLSITHAAVVDFSLSIYQVNVGKPGTLPMIRAPNVASGTAVIAPFTKVLLINDLNGLSAVVIVSGIPPFNRIVSPTPPMSVYGLLVEKLPVVVVQSVPVTLLAVSMLTAIFLALIL